MEQVTVGGKTLVIPQTDITAVVSGETMAMDRGNGDEQMTAFRKCVLTATTKAALV